MKNYLAYPWAILYGLYFYILFQVAYFIRSGSINSSVRILDLGIVVVGIVSVLIFMYFAKKLGERWNLMFIPFILALPLAYFGALGGGLLGLPGIVIYGLVPFIVLLPLCYWFFKRL